MANNLIQDKEKSRISIAGDTIWTVLITLLLLLISLLLIKFYGNEVESFMLASGKWGIFIFVLMAMIAVVFPFWSNLFLIPFAVMAWGPFVTALLSILGWSLGSVIAFYIGRHAHKWAMRHFPSLARYSFVDRLVPERHSLLALIFLRMTFPVDLLSYALGIFSTKVTQRSNFISTLIGITPFAFVFAYLGAMSLQIQLSVFGGTFFLLLIYILLQKKHS